MVGCLLLYHVCITVSVEQRDLLNSAMTSTGPCVCKDIWLFTQQITKGQVNRLKRDGDRRSVTEEGGLHGSILQWMAKEDVPELHLGATFSSQPFSAFLRSGVTRQGENNDAQNRCRSFIFHNNSSISR